MKDRRFPVSEFLVFTNRLTSLCIAILWLKITKTRLKKPPYYKYAYCVFSNIFASLCQYEALNYVSFTLQVMSKSSKIVPTMIMDLILSKCNMKMYRGSGCIRMAEPTTTGETRWTCALAAKILKTLLANSSSSP